MQQAFVAPVVGWTSRRRRVTRVSSHSHRVAHSSPRRHARICACASPGPEASGDDGKSRVFIKKDATAPVEAEKVPEKVSEPKAPVQAKEEAEAPVFAEPLVGESGYINMYDGEQDDIDKTNQTFGMYNQLTERDLFLAKNVQVDGIGNEGPLKLCYREAVPTANYDADECVLCLPGLPASSYSFREVLPLIADQCQVRAVSPDMVGLGFSDKPAPGFVWSYSTDAYVDSIAKFLEAIGVKKLRCVVAQGWLASAGLLYALRNSDLVDSVYILNSPLPQKDGGNPKLPFALSKWAGPGMIGDAFAQDSLSIEKAIEGGSKYQLAVSDAEVYRRPSMLSGDAGFSLAAATRKLSMKGTFAELSKLADWKKPIEVGWGMDDQYLSVRVAEFFTSEVCPQATLTKIEGAGHYTQEDFGERVAENVVRFLRSQ